MQGVKDVHTSVDQQRKRGEITFESTEQPTLRELFGFMSQFEWRALCVKRINRRWSATWTAHGGRCQGST